MNGLFITRYHYKYSSKDISGDGMLLKKIFANVRSNTIGIGPHHGAGIIAQELKNNGLENLDFRDIYDPSLFNNNSNYDFVGISFMDIDQNKAIALSNHFLSKNIPVILGGHRPTLGTNEIHSLTNATIVRGEFEGLGSILINDIKNKKLKPVYMRDTPFDLEHDYIIPDRSIAPLKTRAIQTLELGRGCHNHCDFCSATRIQPYIKLRSLEQISQEIDLLSNKPVLLIDNNLGSYPKDYIKVVFKMLKDKGKYWGGEGTLEQFYGDSEILDLMKSNCLMFFTGVEDFNGTIKGASDKAFNKKDSYDLKQLIQPFKDRDIPCLYSIIFGTDEQTYPESFKSSVKTIRDLGVIVLPHTATPHPGTLWYNKVKAEGRILDYDLTNYDHKLHIVHKPKNMSIDELQSGFREVYSDLFLNYKSHYSWFKDGMKNFTNIKTKIFSVPFILDGIATALYLKYGQFPEKP
jgi:radical SAM superfamily enzyme YgiQ (UPF0313 family)